MKKTATTLSIKPKFVGLLVRKPDGQSLNKTGETVPRTGYWVRRLNEGDVIEVKLPLAKKESK